MSSIPRSEHVELISQEMDADAPHYVLIYLAFRSQRARSVNRGAATTSYHSERYQPLLTLQTSTPCQYLPAFAPSDHPVASAHPVATSRLAARPGASVAVRTDLPCLGAALAACAPSTPVRPLAGSIPAEPPSTRRLRIDARLAQARYRHPDAPPTSPTDWQERKQLRAPAFPSPFDPHLGSQEKCRSDDLTAAVHPRRMEWRGVGVVRQGKVDRLHHHHPPGGWLHARQTRAVPLAPTVATAITLALFRSHRRVLLTTAMPPTTTTFALLSDLKHRDLPSVATIDAVVEKISLASDC